MTVHLSVTQLECVGFYLYSINCVVQFLKFPNENCENWAIYVRNKNFDGIAKRRLAIESGHGLLISMKTMTHSHPSNTHTHKKLLLYFVRRCCSYCSVTFIFKVARCHKPNTHSNSTRILTSSASHMAPVWLDVYFPSDRGSIVCFGFSHSDHINSALATVAVMRNCWMCLCSPHRNEWNWFVYVNYDFLELHVRELWWLKRWMMSSWSTQFRGLQYKMLQNFILWHCQALCLRTEYKHQSASGTSWINEVWGFSLDYGRDPECLIQSISNDCRISYFSAMFALNRTHGNPQNRDLSIFFS